MACRVQSITNNIAQTLTTNSIVKLGPISTNNLVGSTITIMCSGTYLIDVQVIATPTASSTAVIALNVNGVPMASVSRTTTAAPGESIFEVRGLLKLSKGDIITVSNIGAATLTLAAPTPTNGYNVSTIINRLS